MPIQGQNRCRGTKRVGRKPTGHSIRLSSHGRLKKKQSDAGEDEDESRLQDTGRSISNGRERLVSDYDEPVDDYEDSAEHEVEDYRGPLTALGVGLLGAGCFIGVPTCLGIPFLL